MILSVVIVMQFGHVLKLYFKFCVLETIFNKLFLVYVYFWNNTCTCLCISSHNKQFVDFVPKVSQLLEVLIMVTTLFRYFSVLCVLRRFFF